jgi:homoserine kinase
VKIAVHEKIKALAFIPAAGVSTAKARKLLPETVAHLDAASNAGKAALLVHALSHRPDLLLSATEDRIHQQYRGSVMVKSIELVDRFRAAGVAATISGAGPTVLVLHTASETEVEEMVHAAGSSFSAKHLAISHQGYQQA